MTSVVEPLPDEQRLRELRQDLLNSALLRGSFLLSSGVRSGYYLDKYLFETKPGILRRLAHFLAQIVPNQTDRLAGAVLGPVPIVTAVALETGLPFVIVTREPADQGPPLLKGELNAGERVVLIEDIITTGAAAIRAAQQLRQAGAEVLTILAVVDRGQGASGNIEAAGFHMRSLFNRQDLELGGDRIGQA